ncbi:hypothetical protein [Microbacterium arborescens]
MARALVICRDGYWPGLTPDRLWELPYELWGSLALSCDRITEHKKQEAEELERLRSKRR